MAPGRLGITSLVHDGSPPRTTFSPFFQTTEGRFKSKISICFSSKRFSNLSEPSFSTNLYSFSDIGTTNNQVSFFSPSLIVLFNFVDPSHEDGGTNKTCRRVLEALY